MKCKTVSGAFAKCKRRSWHCASYCVYFSLERPCFNFFTFFFFNASLTYLSGGTDQHCAVKILLFFSGSAFVVVYHLYFYWSLLEVTCYRGGGGKGSNN